MMHSGGPGNPNGCVIGCVTDAGRSRKAALCALNLVVHDEEKGFRDTARIKSINLKHSCPTAKLLEMLRKDSTHRKHQGPNFATQATQHVTATGLCEGAFKQDGITISKDQAYRARLQATGDNYNAWLIDLTMMLFLFVLLRKQDPTGIYLLFTKPLSYVVPGAKPDARELVGFIVVPSFLRDEWWFNSSLRLITMDFAHRKGQMGGFQSSAMSKDGYNGNVRLMYAFFPRETKSAWLLTTDCLAYAFPGVALYISDKTKGERECVSCRAS